MHREHREHGFMAEEQATRPQFTLPDVGPGYRRYQAEIQAFAKERRRLAQYFGFDHTDTTMASSLELAAGLSRANILHITENTGTIELDSQFDRLRPGSQLPGSSNNIQHIHDRDMRALTRQLTHAIRTEKVAGPELPGTPEQRAKQLITEWNRCIQDWDWERARELLAHADTDHVLWQRTAVARDLHEALFAIPTPSDQDHDAALFKQKIQTAYVAMETVAKQVVRALKHNQSLADYATSIVTERAIPPVVIEAMYSSRAGSDFDDLAECVYYEAAVEAVWGMDNHPDSINRLKRMFRAVEQQIQRRNADEEVYQRSLISEQEEAIAQTRAEYQKKFELAHTAADREAILRDFEETYDTELFPTGEIVDYAVGDEVYYYNKNTQDPWDKDQYYGVDLKNLILEAIGDIGTEEDIPFVLDAVTSQRVVAPFLEKQAATALSQLGAANAVTHIRRLISSEDILVKRIGLSLLFHIEGKRQAISQGRTQYLDKIIDLGSGDFDGGHIQRITSNGHMGVFSGNSQELRGYFMADQLDTDRNSIRVELLNFTHRALSAPKRNETSEEKAEREQLLEQFAYKFRDFFHGEFFQNIQGVRFQDLSLREQAQFLLAYNKSDAAGKKQLHEYANTFGLDGFRALLSVRYQPELYGKLLNLARQDKNQHQANILRQYGTLVRNAEMTQELLHKHFSHPDTPPEEIYEVLEEEILARAAHTLDRHLSVVSEGTAPPHKQTQIELRELDARINFLTTAYQTQRKLGVRVEMKDIIGFERIVLSGTELVSQHPQLALELERIYRNNFERLYVNRPGADKVQGQKFVEELLTMFRAALHRSNNRFYVYIDTKKTNPNTGQPTVVAFCRFDELTDTEGLPHLHAASANTNPQYKNGDMGLGTLSEAFATEKTRGIPITAECDPGNPATQFYVEELGFIATGYHEINGQPSLDIRIDPSVRATLTSLTWDKRYVELLGLSPRAHYANWEITTQPNFDLLNQGHNLTRIITSESGQKYYVFERPEAAPLAEAT